MKYKDKVFEGAEFPDAPIKKVKVSLSDEIVKTYIPTAQEVKDAAEESKGIFLLGIIMAQKEGFAKGTRSFRTNNPGNIGNVDSGKNQGFDTLADGIKHQYDYIKKVASGKHKAYPIGKQVNIKPYYSEEIAKNQKTYGMEPYLPGYKFTYNGALEQFVKIYSTGARAGNGYLNMIISFFDNHGIEITPKTTLAEIIAIN